VPVPEVSVDEEDVVAIAVGGDCLGGRPRRVAEVTVTEVCIIVVVLGVVFALNESSRS
jgi:hypothetical protein